MEINLEKVEKPSIVEDEPQPPPLPLWALQQGRRGSLEKSPEFPPLQYNDVGMIIAPPRVIKKSSRRNRLTPQPLEILPPLTPLSSQQGRLANQRDSQVSVAGEDVVSPDLSRRTSLTPPQPPPIPMWNEQPQDLRVSRNQQQSRRGSLAKERDDQGSVAIPVAGDGKVSSVDNDYFLDEDNIERLVADGSYRYQEDEDRADIIIAEEIERDRVRMANIINQRQNNSNIIISITSVIVGGSLSILGIVMLQKTSFNPMWLIPLIIGLLIIFITRKLLERR